MNKQKTPLKSTSPFPSVSNMSMTLCTSGFCCSSGRDMNSSTLREPELSRSSFLNRFPSLLISSASTEIETEMEKIVKKHCFNSLNISAKQTKQENVLRSFSSLSTDLQKRQPKAVMRTARVSKYTHNEPILHIRGSLHTLPSILAP